MAFDEKLAERIRQLLAGRAGLTEKRMFGGVAFLIHGNMAIAASSHGGVLVRAGPERAEVLLDEPGARMMVMRGRAMRGWLRIAPDQLRTKQKLEKWVDIGESFARSLPKKG